jgi:hypothetical protein
MAVVSDELTPVIDELEPFEELATPAVPVPTEEPAAAGDATQPQVQTEDEPVHAAGVEAIAGEDPDEERQEVADGTEGSG